MNEKKYEENYEENYKTFKENQNDMREKILKNKKTLGKLFSDVTLVFGLCKDYIRGNYRKAPKKTIAALLFSLVYFFSPIDVIPDFIPIIGYLDDVAVFSSILAFAQKDIKAYSEYLKSVGKEHVYHEE